MLARTLIPRMLLAVALAAPCAACTDTSPETATPTVPSAPAPAGSTSAPTTIENIPVVKLVTDVQGDAGGSLSRDALATLVAEALGDNADVDLQTVVCGADLPAGSATGSECTLTRKDSTTTADEVWRAYATRNPDGTPAVLLLRGDPLTDEFTHLLASPGTYLTTASIDPAYSSVTVPAGQARQDAQAVLRSVGSAVALGDCTGDLSFARFDAVTCAETDGPRAGTALILPGSFVADAPGLIVVVHPTA